jgi:hypothetical protein
MTQIQAAARLICSMAVLTNMMTAQSPSPLNSMAKESVLELIAHLDKGEGTPRIVGRLVELHAIEARPAIERAFERASTKAEKQALAAGLSALGATNRRFTEYLASFATQAAESDMPFPYLLNTNGTVEAGSHRRNRAFMAWCDRSRLDPDVAVHLALSEYPLDVRFLSMARSAAAESVLLRALQSPNYFISEAAAEGLAAFGSPEYLPLVIAAARRAPHELAIFYAQAILEFAVEGTEQAAKELVFNEEIFNQLMKQKALSGKAR